MTLRFGLVTLAITGMLIAYLSPRGISTENLASVVLGLLLALMGSMLSRRRGPKFENAWRHGWLSLLAVIWTVVTGMVVLRQFSGLDGFGMATVDRLRPYLVSTTLLVGSLVTVGRAPIPLRPALSLMLPGWVAVLLLINPAGALMPWLAILAAAGLPPKVVKSEVAGPPMWREAPAVLVETVSLQCVGWGLVLSVLGFVLELAHGKLFTACFVGFGTGFTAWLASGLLWGIAEHFRAGRLSLERPARLLFGPGVAAGY